MGFLNAFETNGLGHFRCFFPPPGLSFHSLAKKWEIQNQGQVFALIFLGEEIRNILVQENQAESG